MSFTIVFHDAGREPQCPPNPKFPNGRDVDTSTEGKPSCQITFEYPAPRCGAYVAVCDRCGSRFAITVAGRPDDPKTWKVACPEGAPALQ